MRARQRKTRVLVVDACAETREALALAIEEAGHGVAVAASDREALLKLALCPPDLVILDLAGSGEGGAALLRHLRHGTSLRQVRIVLVAGAGTSLVSKVLRPDACFLKPVDSGALIASIAELTGPEGPSLPGAA